MRFRRSTSAGLADASWRTIARELVITTLGVLVALALNSWWGERQDRKREAAYLAQITADIDRSIAPPNLPATLRKESEAATATAKLLRAFRETTAPPADSIVAWLYRAETFENYTPITSTARAMLTTGDINLIHTDSVREIIPPVVSTVDARTQEMHDYELRWRDEAAELERYTDYIAIRERVLGPAATDSLARADSTFEVPPSPRREPFGETDYVALLHIRDVYRALVKMYTAHRNAVRILDEELRGLRAARGVFAAQR